MAKAATSSSSCRHRARSSTPVRAGRAFVKRWIPRRSSWRVLARRGRPKAASRLRVEYTTARPITSARRLRRRAHADHELADARARARCSGACRVDLLVTRQNEYVLEVTRPGMTPPSSCEDRQRRCSTTRRLRDHPRHARPRGYPATKAAVRPSHVELAEIRPLSLLHRADGDRRIVDESRSAALERRLLVVTPSRPCLEDLSSASSALNSV